MWSNARSLEISPFVPLCGELFGRKAYALYCMVKQNGYSTLLVANDQICFLVWPAAFVAQTLKMYPTLALKQSGMLYHLLSGLSHGAVMTVTAAPGYPGAMPARSLPHCRGVQDGGLLAGLCLCACHGCHIQSPASVVIACASQAGSYLVLLSQKGVIDSQ